VNFGPLTKKLKALMMTHPSWLFQETKFWPLGVLVAQIFTCTRDWPRLSSAHPK